MKFLTLFLIGGVGYNLIEIIWRGYTHISMTVAGGVAFILIYLISFLNVPLIFKSFLGGAAITAVELLSGLVVNMGMGLSVWNYSNQKFNFLGQICLLYSVLWVLLCIPLNLILEKVKS